MRICSTEPVTSIWGSVRLAGKDKQTPPAEGLLLSCILLLDSPGKGK